MISAKHTHFEAGRRTEINVSWGLIISPEIQILNQLEEKEAITASFSRNSVHPMTSYSSTPGTRASSVSSR